jgi:hypothetical protein
MLIQLFANERTEANQPIHGVIKSYATKLITLGRRGFNELMLRRALLMTWRLHSGVKQRGVGWYYMPYGWIHGTLAAGGGGCHPSVIWGANKDPNIVMDLRDKWPHYIPAVEKGLAAVKAMSTQIRTHVSKSIIQGNITPIDTFARGISLFEAIRIPSRMRAEYEIAKTGEFNGLERLRYSRMPENLARKAVAEDPSMRKLELADQDMSGSKMKLAELAGKRVPYDTHLKWIHEFRLVETGKVDNAHEYRVIPVLRDKEWAPLRAFGGVGSTNIAMTSPARLLSPLRRDPRGRRDISDEELMELLATPGHNADKNTRMLVYMGFEKEASIKVATAFDTSASTQIISSNATPFSGNDGYMQMMDMSLAALQENFTVDATGNRSVDGSLYQIALMHSVISGYKHSAFPKYHVELRDESIGNIMSILRGHDTYSRSLHLINIYPSRIWTEKNSG